MHAHFGACLSGTLLSKKGISAIIRPPDNSSSRQMSPLPSMNPFLEPALPRLASRWTRLLWLPPWSPFRLWSRLLRLLPPLVLIRLLLTPSHPHSRLRSYLQFFPHLQTHLLFLPSMRWLLPILVRCLHPLLVTPWLLPLLCLSLLLPLLSRLPPLLLHLCHLWMMMISWDGLLLSRKGFVSALAHLFTPSPTIFLSTG